MPGFGDVAAQILRLGHTGMRESADTARSNVVAYGRALERAVWPLRIDLLRDARGLASALQTIDDALAMPSADGTAVAAGRSARALLYVARLAYTSALPASCASCTVR